MDIDALTAARKGRWARLDALAKKRNLSGAEADEMTRLFQQTAGDLASVQSSAPEPGLVSRLSMSLASARVWMTGSHSVSIADLGRVVTRELPAALYRIRWWAVGVSLGVVTLAMVSAVHTLTSPEALELVGDAQTRAQIAQHEFESYYHAYDHASFAAEVWTNNWLLALGCIAAGWTVFVPYILLRNTIVQLGVAAAIMAEHGMLDVFFQLIAPHGLLELSAVFVAAAAGLRILWVVLVPGPRPRSVAVAEEGRATVTIALGVGVVLLISGLVEGFVTPSPLPWALKDAIGVVLVTGFWLYVFVVGRAAVRAGATGDVEGAFEVAAIPRAA
jgi:uncharacterized membrane protein SpoIIM required for sporulation